MAPHILRSYDEAFADLTSQVEAIAGMALSNLESACGGLLQKDESRCLRAIADDEEVNNLERRIDTNGLDIMTRYQPVARDLRRVLASMRIANNIERVSDEAKNIARRARGILDSGFTGGNAAVEAIFALAKAEFQDAVASFLSSDKDLCATIHPRDKELDARYRETAARFSEHIAASNEHAKDYLALLFIIRSLERIGDHAKNIAEESDFLEHR